jgi:hypothetical protein
MQQRRLRLGDILDDYCPRERRITNHVVVAMIDDEVKQTRCTTCDADHEYKEARIPPQRRKRLEDAAALEEARGRLRSSDDAAELNDTPFSDGGSEDETDSAATPDDDLALDADGSRDDGPDESAPATNDDGPVHRRLIRATLPRPEGQVPDRKEPEFTIRQPGMRGPDGRKGGRHGRRPMRGAQGGNWQGQPPRQGSGQPANRPGGARSGGAHGNRSQGNRAGQPGGGRGNRQGPGGGGRGGGRKRGR